MVVSGLLPSPQPTHALRLLLPESACADGCMAARGRVLFGTLEFAAAHGGVAVCWPACKSA